MDMSATIRIPNEIADGRHPDAEILTSFAQWKTEWAARDRLTYGDHEADERSWAAISDLDERVRTAIAVTPAGAAAQLWLSLIHNRSVSGEVDENALLKGDIECFSDDRDHDRNDRLVFAALRSLTAMARAPAHSLMAPAEVSLHAPFEAWRSAYQAHAIASDLNEDDEDLDGEELQNENIAFRALMAAPCASPGDFMVKCFVNLLDQLGSAEHGEAKLDGTGNLWDVDVPKANPSGDLDSAWERSAYHDLDQSDLGACLLAFGRLDFSAGDWLRRARALKVPIGLTVTGPNEWSLHVGPYAGDDDCERRRRERARLERLLEFDPARRQAVIEVILRAWPLPDAPLAKAA